MSFKPIWWAPLAAAFLAAGCAHIQTQVQTAGVGSTPSTGSTNSGPADSPQTVTTAPTFTPMPQPAGGPNQTLTLAFVGDIMMGEAAADKLKTEGPDSFFLYTAPFLKRADIALGNLEGPMGTKGTGNRVRGKKFTFLVDPSAATGLLHAGFKVLTLANNHTMDFGVDALQSTLAVLDKAGLKHAGAGFNLAHARRPAWVEVKGRKVAILAYSLTLPIFFWATDTRAGTAPARGAEMKEDIQAARAQGADLVVVCCHWGKEKHTKLEWYQTSLAHLAIESGADAVVCHHPHIWQGLEVYQGKPIAYSIGNFAFGSMSRAATVSGILYLSFDGQSRQWKGGKIVPLNVNNPVVRFCPRPLDEKGAGKFMNYLHRLSKTADLALEDSEITWKAPDENRKDAVTTATPTPLPPRSFSVGGPTPTAGVGENPNGSLPGMKRP